MAKILLVEDDNSLREIFEMRMQAEGYQTVTAGNGEEGLTVAMREKPDLIVADVMMPKLNGFDMLETLRATPEMRNTKVIMMTALGQAEDQARGEKLGVVKYLVKSQATLEDFTRVIKEVLPIAGSTALATPGDQPSSIQNSNQQESENNMPDDQTPPVPANDGGVAPAEPTTPPANPVAGDSGAPQSPISGQMSTAQEQSTVTDQINDFASSTPSDTAEPAVPTAPEEPAMPAQPSSSFAPASPPADASTTPYDQPAATTDNSFGTPNPTADSNSANDAADDSSQPGTIPTPGSTTTPDATNSQNPQSV